MPKRSAAQSPTIAKDPHGELARLIERSIRLQNQALATNQKFKELNEQIAQRHQTTEADREQSTTAGKHPRT